MSAPRRTKTTIGMGAARRGSLPPPSSAPITAPRPKQTMKLPTSGEQQKAVTEEQARPVEQAPRSADRSEPPARDDAPPSRRTPVSVDQVGDAAVRLAARARRKSGVCPRVTVPSRVLASAKLTKREAFVASLLDGDLTLSEIVEASGMTEATVTAAIRELVRLGLAKL